MAVGSLDVTVTPLPDAGMVKYRLLWVSDASGNCSGNDTSMIHLGEIEQVKFIPDSGGTAPTALYDVTLVDSNGVDFLGGAGANLSATVATQTPVTVPLFYDGLITLDLVVANAGVSKGGTVVLWLQQTGGN